MHGNNAIYSQNTRVLPAFGAVGREERNQHLTRRVMLLNYGMDKIASGEKWQETTNDPLGRDARYIIQKQREETNTLGRARSRIRPAAPQQVTWKNDYWYVQRRRSMRQTRIGPYPIASLEKESILYRLSDAFSQFAQGG
jgi:hypothetical protein